MARACLPLNAAAVAAADAALFDRTTPPGRRLSPSDPADASLRVQWMRAYAQAGGAVYEDQHSQGVDDPALACEQPAPPDYVPADFVTFRLIEDSTGMPVAGVAMNIRHPDGTTQVHRTDASGSVSLAGITGSPFEVLAVGDPVVDSVVWVDTVDR